MMPSASPHLLLQLQWTMFTTLYTHVQPTPRNVQILQLRIVKCVYVDTSIFPQGENMHLITWFLINNIPLIGIVLHLELQHFRLMSI